MPGSAKLLLLALDAAEPTLVRRWADEGRLPNLASMMRQGSSVDLESAAQEFPDEVWPSIYSSANAASFGKYYYIQPRPGSEALELMDDAPKGKQFWLTLSEAGRRCAVVDPPKTALGPRINGVQIANWGAHATRCDRTSHPPELIDEVLRQVGPYPLHTCDNHGRSAAEYRKLREQLIAGVRKRGKLLLLLLEREDWDLFFAAFSETHCAGHQFWHLQDPEHPLYDREDRHDLNSALLDVYTAIDEQIGEAIQQAGPDAQVIVFSGHGMTAQYHGRDLLPTLLGLWGCDQPENIEPDPAREKHYEVGAGFVRTLKERVPIGLQYAVKQMLPKSIEQALICRLMGSKDLDPNARFNYVPNNDLNPAFRINLKGRDPHGTVAPGAEYDALCDFLEQRLNELINVKTGKPAIRNTSRLRDTHSGPYIDVLPDVCGMWSNEAWIDEVRSPGYGTVSGAHRDLRTGGHDTKGFLAMLAPEARIDLASQPPNAKDVAPTVLSLLGVPVPAEMEGRSLAAVG